MWTAQVADKKNSNGSLTVNVQYTDGANLFNDVIDLSGGDVEGAKARVRNRLSTLNASDSLFASIPLGFNNFTAAASPAPTARETFVANLRKFQACQRAVTLGLITNSDSVYTSAQAAMLSVWDPSFIDNV